MLKLLQFLTNFYWLLLPEFVFQNLRRVQWQSALDEGGPAGLASELAGGVIGLNAIPFYTKLDGKWSGRQIEKLLNRHGIRAWSWGFAFDEMFFHVHRDDAFDAQQILLAAGVELRG